MTGKPSGTAPSPPDLPRRTPDEEQDQDPPQPEELAAAAHLALALDGEADPDPGGADVSDLVGLAALARSLGPESDDPAGLSAVEARLFPAVPGSTEAASTEASAAAEAQPLAPVPLVRRRSLGFRHALLPLGVAAGVLVAIATSWRPAPEDSGALAAHHLPGVEAFDFPRPEPRSLPAGLRGSLASTRLLPLPAREPATLTWLHSLNRSRAANRRSPWPARPARS